MFNFRISKWLILQFYLSNLTQTSLVNNSILKQYREDSFSINTPNFAKLVPCIATKVHILHTHLFFKIFIMVNFQMKTMANSTLCTLCSGAQFCPTLWDPMNYSPPGFSVHGILQARILEWVTMPSSRGSSQPRDQMCNSCVSCIGRQIIHDCANLELTLELSFTLHDTNSPCIAENMPTSSERTYEVF